MLAEKAGFPVKLMAHILGVSRSGFYSWLANGCPKDDWSADRDAVMRVRLESDRRFGFRFVHAMLPQEFSHLTRYRVLKLMRELGIRGCTPNASKRTTIPGPTWCAVTSRASSHLQARRRHHLSAHRRGMVVPGHGDRPVHAHGGGMVALGPDDRRHHRGGLGIREVARLRGRKRHFPFRQRRPIHQQDLGRVGAGQRRAPFLQPHRQLPRQRRGHVVLRHPEERDVLPQALPGPRHRQTRRHRVHRGRLQTQAAPFDHRPQGAGADYGVVLRAHEARIRASSHGRLVPRAYVSENLTQVTRLVLAGHRVPEGLLIAVHKSEVDHPLSVSIA